MENASSSSAIVRKEDITDDDLFNAPDALMDMEEVGDFLPIVTFNLTEDSVMELQTDNLNLILSRCADRPLVIVSILGPNQKGKSTYLKLAVDHPVFFGDMWKYLENSSPSTSGIQFWSKPMLTKLEGGTEVAVLLMDTQGLRLSSTRESMWIFGLVSLISSVAIFNQDLDRARRINVDFLFAWMNFLEHFPATLGKVPKILFLLRDSHYTEGKEDLMEFLQGQEVDTSSEADQRHLKSAMEILERTFDEKNLWRIPCPLHYSGRGKTESVMVGTTYGFHWEIGSSVEDTFSQTALTIKKIFGMELTSKHLGQVFQECITFLNQLERHPSSPLGFAGIEDKLRVLGTEIFMEKKTEWLHAKMKTVMDNSPYGFLDQKTLVEQQVQLKMEVLNEYGQHHPRNSPGTETVGNWLSKEWEKGVQENHKLGILAYKFRLFEHFIDAVNEYQNLVAAALDVQEFQRINFPEIEKTCLENFVEQFPADVETDESLGRLVQTCHFRLKEKFAKDQEVLEKAKKNGEKSESEKYPRRPHTRSQSGITKREKKYRNADYN